jgi:hypothetical protein
MTEQIDAEQFEEFKLNVIKTARKYAIEHNWCGVVDKALEEMGLGPVWQPVKLNITVEYAAVVEVDKNIFDKLTPEQQQKLAMESIVVNERFGRARVTIAPGAPIQEHRSELASRKVTSMVVDSNLDMPDLEYLWFAVTTGRVQHAWLSEDDAHPLCEQVYAPGRYNKVYRPSFSRCKRCEKKAAND